MGVEDGDADIEGELGTRDILADIKADEVVVLGVAEADTEADKLVALSVTDADTEPDSTVELELANIESEASGLVALAIMDAETEAERIVPDGLTGTDADGDNEVAENVDVPVELPELLITTILYTASLSVPPHASAGFPAHGVVHWLGSLGETGTLSVGSPLPQKPVVGKSSAKGFAEGDACFLSTHTYFQL